MSRGLEDLQASIDDIKAQALQFNKFLQRMMEAEDDEQAAQTWVDEQAVLKKCANDACAALAGSWPVGNQVTATGTCSSWQRHRLTGRSPRPDKMQAERGPETRQADGRPWARRLQGVEGML
jgi:hypothetical protein